jgi:hypothetical protein
MASGLLMELDDHNCWTIATASAPGRVALIMLWAHSSRISFVRIMTKPAKAAPNR